MGFIYAIIRDTDWGHEIREDRKGDDINAKFSDSRILRYGKQKKAKHIFKIYADSSCEVML